jgi:HEAT repeat protein
LFASLLLAIAPVQSNEPVSPPPPLLSLETSVESAGPYISKALAHATIRDYRGAADAANRGLTSFPDNVKLRQIQLEALGQLSDEKELLSAWQSTKQQFGNKIPPEILEEISWALIRHGNRSPAHLPKLYSLVGAAMTHDTRAIELIQNGITDRNVLIRSMSVRFAGMLRDRSQQEALLTLFNRETDVSVRQELIHAFATMHIDQAKPLLEKLIADDRTESSERLDAIGSMINLIDHCGIDQVEPLLESNKTGLRLLGVHLAAIFEVQKAIPRIIALANDPIPEVRVGALMALDLLSNDENWAEIEVVAKKNEQELDPKVSITASWLLAKHNPEAIPNLTRHLSSSREETQLFAASALAKVGSPATEALFTHLNHPSPIVRLNLALGLIPYRQHNEEAAKCILSILETSNEKLAGIGFWIFHGVLFTPLVPQEESEVTKLNILTKVALISPDLATEAIRQFLLQRPEVLKQMAAISLIQEGESGEYEVIKKIIHDPSPRVRLQASYLLALWAQDHDALEVLISEYPNASREMKERILEGIGSIGGGAGVEFLAARLDDPFPTIRILAATAMLQTLNQ